MFKENLGKRSRPNDILQFGGKEILLLGLISDGCNSNCSFVSGDASVGFSLIALYFLTKNKIFIGLLYFLDCFWDL